MIVAVTSCGPPKPVLFYMPPSVQIDTSSHSARRVSTITSGSHSFWEAMSSLDTGYVYRHQVSDTQRDFAKALSLIMNGRHDDAALALDAIHAASTDSTIRVASRVLMTAMLQYQDNWKLLAELDSLARVNKKIDTADKAGVESWAIAFRQVPSRQIRFADAPAVLPLSLSVSGVPMIEVTINGKRHTFWLDTGASMSIVSSNVATELGMRPLTRDTLEVATTTGRVAAQPSQIERLQLGTIEVRNTPALIVASDRMLVRLGDQAGVPVVSEIEGVIGFDLISRFDLRIDYANARVTLAKPATNVRLPSTGRNLFWVGTPIVRLVTSKGIPLHFNLDTGAQETYSTDGLPIKTKARTFRGERRLIGGLAGVTSVHGRFVDELRASMGGQAMVLRKLMIFIPEVSSFVGLDGILGSDIGKGGVVRIDATNGLFMIEEARRGLRGPG
jgi:clan AA aspartic protease (TIGR02281 family)